MSLPEGTTNPFLAYAGPLTPETVRGVGSPALEVVRALRPHIEGARVWHFGCGAGAFLWDVSDIITEGIGVENDADLASAAATVLSSGVAPATMRVLSGPFNDATALAACSVLLGAPFTPAFDPGDEVVLTCGRYGAYVLEPLLAGCNVWSVGARFIEREEVDAKQLDVDVHIGIETETRDGVLVVRSRVVPVSVYRYEV